MLKRFITIISALFLLLFEVSAQTNIWTIGTALTKPKGQYSFGIFQPFRYGLTKSLEFSAHPVLFLAMPNASLKKHWYTTENEWYFSTRHALHYPTLFFRLTSRKGLMGLLPPHTVVPHTLAFANEFLASTWLIKETSCDPPNLLLTLKAGVKNGLKLGETTVPSFDYPLAYQQASVYLEKKPVWYIGADLDGVIGNGLNFCVDIDFISVNWGVDDYAVEHKSLLVIPFARRMTFAAGYKLSYGTYPYGNDLFIMPLVDLIWDFKRKEKRDNGLFEKDMF